MIDVASILGLIFTGLALVLVRTTKPLAISVSQLFAVATIVVSSFAIAAFIYGVSPNLGASIVFAAISVGVLFAGKEYGVMKVLTSSGPGGLLSRWLLLASLTTPYLLGYLLVSGVRAGVFSFELGVAIFVVIGAGSFASFVLIIGEILDAGAQRLKDIDRAKTEFISLASHQLRDPLAVINWYSELLLEKKPDHFGKTQLEYLEQIQKSGRRMASLISALLDVARIELGTFISKPDLVSVSAISHDVVSELKPSAKRKRIKVDEEYEDNLPQISADREFIRIIFVNLVSNAIAYTPSGGKIGVEIKKEFDNLTIRVWDTGYGIPKDEQIKIFTKLFRGKNIKEKEPGGTGLGLYIVKEIVEKIGGKIRFTSKEGIGSSFYVNLPLSKTNQHD